MEITLRDFRSYAGHHSFDLKPLTILVGENSSGKSNLLGALCALGKLSVTPDPFPSDISPFAWPSFHQLKCSLSEVSDFALGVRHFGDKKSNIEFRFGEAFRGSSLLSVQASLHTGEALIAERIDKGFRIRGGRITKADKFARNRFWFDSDSIESLGMTVAREGTRSMNSLLKAMVQKKSHTNLLRMELLSSMLDVVQNLPHITVAPLAPVRTQPRRISEITNASFSNPEGAGSIEWLYALSEDKEKEHLMKTMLLHWGQSMGLFENIRIKKAFKSLGNAVSLEVQVNGIWQNLADVGYGVSQVLPVMSHILSTTKNTYLLVQQPEVHLHPKAQAAAGSMFATAVESGFCNAVIETHSDFIIDRIFYEMRSGNIDPSKVALYFVKYENGSSHVYPISIDDSGNIIEAPEGYRDFFIAELQRHLS